MTDIICVTNRHLCEGDFFEMIDKIASCGVNIEDRKSVIDKINKRKQKLDQ